jgi:hypothetical protein
MRHVVMVAALSVATTAVAGKASRVQPTSTKIKAPKKLARIKLPKGLPTDLPASRWWEAADPCPAGAVLQDDDGDHACVDAAGQGHGPFTDVDGDGRVVETGWRRRGKLHGRVRHHDNGEYTYVDDVRHGPASEWGDEGSYRKGVRHGLWSVVLDGGGTVRGYFVDGKREGTWLAIGTQYGEEVVLARAAYRKDAVRGEVVWWTEDGTLLATITQGRGGRAWQLHGKGTAEMTAVCDGERLNHFRMTAKDQDVTCVYDERGALVSARGDEDRTLRCPEATTGGWLELEPTLCKADLLDVWSLYEAYQRAGAIR